MAGLIYAVTRSQTGAHGFDDVHTVDINTAKALLAAGGVLLDVREQAAYEAKHIAGALTLPSLSAGGLIAKTANIVVYCGDGSTLGPRAAHTLTQAGFTHVANLEHGLPGWVDAGLPVESGAGKRV
ncbi:rhodanese-like domain-containing protein [Zoogloea sp.]|uniref:rhodanese-like domain-containing protein n=1 Tax=Zoogloea sp. TaxID=49181 RepID=UPI0035B1A098